MEFFDKWSKINGYDVLMIHSGYGISFEIWNIKLQVSRTFCFRDNSDKIYFWSIEELGYMDLETSKYNKFSDTIKQANKQLDKIIKEIKNAKI